MKNIVVFFGGNSCESEVSIITAIQAMANLDKSKYNVYPIFIKENNMYFSKDYFYIDSFKKNSQKNKNLKENVVSFACNNLYIHKAKKAKFLATIDCAVLCTHGGSGENGGLQGFCELHNIAYTSCNVKASSIGMNKALSKLIFNHLELNQTEYLSITSDQLSKGIDVLVSDVLNKLKFPLMIKPCSQGSSIGIKKAKNEEDLKNAILTAFEYDNEVIIEKALENFIELNCSAVKNVDEIIISDIEKVEGWEEFLTFEKKYLQNGKMNGSTRQFPAKINSEIEKEIKTITKKVYEFLDLKGVVRIDFMLDAKNVVHINEINTIPGSLAFYLYENKNIGMSKLLDIMVNTAIKEKIKNDKLEHKFKSEILNACGKSLKYQGK